MAGKIVVSEILSDTSSSNTVKIGSGMTLDLNAQGTVKMPAGSVSKVFSLTMTGKFTMTSTTAATISDGTTAFSQVITPSATTSKILLIAHLQGSGDADSSPSFVFNRSGTNIALSTGNQSNREIGTGTFGYQMGVGDQEIYTCSMMFLDSPSTTSATTYTVKMWNADADGNSIHINRTRSNNNSGSYTDPVSTFAIMEIAG